MTYNSSKPVIFVGSMRNSSEPDWDGPPNLIDNDYLIQELCYNEPLEGKFNIFAVEGATAGMCYIFDSLIANNILSKGDKIALMAPIFTPYLEIPHLPRYSFEVIKITADEISEDGSRTWQYPASEIDKLLREQDEDKKERARRRYSGLSTNPDKIPFIDRMNLQIIYKKLISPLIFFIIV